MRFGEDLEGQAGEVSLPDAAQNQEQFSQVVWKEWVNSCLSENIA